MVTISYLTASTRMTSNKGHSGYVICWPHCLLWHNPLQESETYLSFMTRHLDSTFWRFLFMARSNISLLMILFHAVNQLNLHSLPNRMEIKYGFVWLRKRGRNVLETTWKLNPWRQIIWWKIWPCAQVLVFGLKTKHKKHVTSICTQRWATLLF